MSMRIGKKIQTVLRQDNTALNLSDPITSVDVDTLVWTRGRDFPLSRLDSRLKCPRCGSRKIVVMFEPPSKSGIESMISLIAPLSGRR